MSVASIIVAVGGRGVIGVDNTLPWHLPEDLRHFKATTMGHHVIIGRRTYESLGRPLPGRTLVVLSRDAGYAVQGGFRAGSLQEALAACGDDPEVFIAGGAQIYAQAMDLAQRLYLTEVDVDIAGDAYFPPIDSGVWREVGRQAHQAANGLVYAFVTYERR